MANYINNGDGALSIREKLNSGLFTPATATRAGSIVSITAPDGAKHIEFTAPSDFSAGDTYRLNGTALTVRSQFNVAPTAPWKSGALVQMSLTGSTGFVCDYIDKATMEEAAAGTNNSKYVTPLTAKSTMESNGGFLSDLEGNKYKAINVDATKVYGLNSTKSKISSYAVVTDSYIVRVNKDGSNVGLHSKEYPYDIIKNVSTGTSMEAAFINFATDECVNISYGSTSIFVFFNFPGKYLNGISRGSAIKAGTKVLSYTFDSGYLTYTLFNPVNGTKEIDNKTISFGDGAARYGLGATETYFYFIKTSEKAVTKITLSTGGINTIPLNITSTISLGYSYVLYISSQESIFYFTGNVSNDLTYVVCRLNVKAGTVSILVDSNSSFAPLSGQSKNFSGVFDNGNILMVQSGMTYVLSTNMQIISSTPNTLASNIGGVSNIPKFKILNNRYGVFGNYGYLYDTKLNILVYIQSIVEFYSSKTEMIFTENDNWVVGLIAEKYSTANEYGLLDMKRAQYKIEYICPID